MTKEKIVIASDHGGFELKALIIDYLSKKDFDVIDFGTYNKESCDYPIYAKKVCSAILNHETEKGILVCGTGIGMQIMANRFKGIRAVCPLNSFQAEMSRKHNNTNVLTLGERVVGRELAYNIIDAWLNTNFEAGRHQKRVDMLDK